VTRLDTAHDRIDTRRQLDVRRGQIDDDGVRRIRRDLSLYRQRMREELEQLLWCADDERVNRRRRVLEDERAVELRRELHLHEILVRLFCRHDEPEDDRDEQRRAFQREPLGEGLEKPPPPGHDQSLAGTVLRRRSRRPLHARSVRRPRA
jgi:hypothetical protein